MPIRRAVVQIDPKTGNILKVYPSVRAAERVITQRMSSGCVILQACKGKTKTGYGFVWMYSDEANDPDKYAAHMDRVRQPRIHTGGKKRRPVVQLDRGTMEMINGYPSVSDAAKAVDGQVPRVIDACKNTNHTAYGYYWRYAD